MKKLMFMALAGAILSLSGVAYAETDGQDHKGHHKGHHKGGKFAMHDTDGDGVISKSEFMKIHEERFSEIDTDGSGDLSKEEIKAMKGKMKDKGKGMREKFKEKRGPQSE